MQLHVVKTGQVRIKHQFCANGEVGEDVPIDVGGDLSPSSLSPELRNGMTGPSEAELSEAIKNKKKKARGVRGRVFNEALGFSFYARTHPARILFAYLMGKRPNLFACT